MGFPEHQATVDHRRHQAVGVERAVSRIVEAAEASAAVDALERQADLVEQPEHFLDVGGIGSAVHHNHRCAPIAGSPLCVLRDASSGRSEEHTSELQSLMRISYAVFCLKKKK